MSIQLEVGRSYVARDGSVHGPLVAARSMDYPFACLGQRWSPRGYRELGVLTHPLDLVAEYVETGEPPQGTLMTADAYLRYAASTMAERGKQYDSPEGERSMGKTVAAFNAITGRDLTEAEGWLLMLVLKQVRQFQAGPHMDSALDAVAYAALLAEARMK